MSAITALTDLAAEINQAHQLAEQSARMAIDHARRAGELLIQAKAAVPHGQWLPWLSENVTVGVRQAQRYMRLAQHPELANATSESHLTLSGALAAITEPRDAYAIAQDDLRARLEAEHEEFREIMGYLRRHEELPDHLRGRLVDLIGDDHVEAIGMEAALNDSRRFRPIKAPNSKIGELPTWLPSPGQVAIAVSGDHLLACQESADHPGFFDIFRMWNHSANNNDDHASLDYFLKPVAGWALSQPIPSLMTGTPHQSLEALPWEYVEAEPGFLRRTFPVGIAA